MFSVSKNYNNIITRIYLIENKIQECYTKINKINDEIIIKKKEKNKCIDIYIKSNNNYNLDIDKNNNMISVLGKNLNILKKYIIELNNEKKLYNNDLTLITKDIKEKNINYYSKILSFIDITYHISIININYEIYPFTYIDTSIIPVIKKNYCLNEKFSFIPFKYNKIENIDNIRIINNSYSRKFNYFLQVLIFNILKLDVFIRGGFIRDLFSKKKNTNHIDIDIYTNKETFKKLIKKIYVNNSTNEAYNIFHYIINTLSLLILAKPVKFKYISIYENVSYSTNIKCMKMLFEINNINISFDINQYNYYQYCNSNLKFYNIDFLINGLVLSLKDNIIKIDFVCYNNYITEFLKKYKIINNNFNIILDLLPNINEMIDDTTKIIYMIINKKTPLCHHICTNDKKCSIKNCKRCYSIEQKMCYRYKKMSSNFELILERCNKKYCIYDILINYDINNEFFDANEQIYYNNKSSSYGTYIRFEP